MRKERLLKFNIKVMRLLNLWPNNNGRIYGIFRVVKDYSLVTLIMFPTSAVFSDFKYQMNGNYDDVLDITENLTALTAVFGMIYMVICFIQNRSKIMNLVSDLHEFEHYGTEFEMIKTEKKASLYTKIFIWYGILGNLFYLAVPYIDLETCYERKLIVKYSKDIPCGLITRFRLPFKYEDSLLMFLLVMGAQLFSCLMTTIIVLAITMFLIGLLMQVITQMKQLKKMITQLDFNKDMNQQNKDMRTIILYHIMINKYSLKVTDAFSSMMLIHITLTSFEISVLGFEVLMVTSKTDSLRFGMHLIGWLVLLFFICFYGQKMIDESIGIGFDVYSTKWYDSSTSIQKDLLLIIIRSQEPLTLSAASLGIMSLETYLKVMTTAYSYFTLLLNFKTNN